MKKKKNNQILYIINKRIWAICFTYISKFVMNWQENSILAVPNSGQKTF